MKIDIPTLLEMTGNTYEKMVINHYHQWCSAQSYDDTDCQKLLANKKLFNWWLNQYNQLQAKFARRAVEFYGKADKEVMKKYHAEIVAQVRDFYCKPLLKAARKHQPITPQYN